MSYGYEYFNSCFLYVFGESYSVLGIYPNEYAKFMVPGLVSWIYLAIRNHKNKYHWISLIGIGMFICVVFANGSRSGILSAIFIILVGIFFYYRTLKMNCETGDGRRMALRKTAVAILICFTTAIGTLGFIYIVTPYLDNTLSVEVFAETTENTKEDENPYVPGSLEYMSFEGEKLIDDHEFLIELDKISTGRIWIWSAYLNNITWKGQNTPIYSYGPHNQFVEFSYNAGLLTGIIWLICVLTIGGTLIYRGFSKKQTTVYFPIMMYLTYFIFTMLDTGVAPFGKTHIYLFFITLIAVMTDKKERVTVEDISTGKLDNK